MERRPRRWLRLPSELVWLIGQIRPVLHWHIASLAAIGAGSLLALTSPFLLKWLIDGIIPQKRVGLLPIVVGLVFLSHEGRVALSSLGSYLVLGASLKMALALRIGLLKHLDSLSADYFDQTSVGEAMYPLKEPIEEIAYFGSDLLPTILGMFFATCFSLVAMATVSPLLTLAVLPSIPIFLLTKQYFQKELVETAEAAQQYRIGWSKFIEEHVSSAVGVQLLSQVKRQERKAFRLLARNMRSQQHLLRTAGWFMIWSSLPVVLALSAVIGYGGDSVLRGSFSVGSLIAFYGFVTQLFEPLAAGSELYARTQKTFASIRQVQAVLRLQPSVKNTPSAVLLAEDCCYGVAFRGVEFGYVPSSQPLLQVPWLQVSAGEQVAIAGANGAGKSTLVKLIARLYDPTLGTILLGGRDMRGIHLKSLRQTVCYLQRDPTLFDASIEFNLSLSTLAVSENELDAALHAVGLSHFVSSLPAGLRHNIGPGGCKLSGGERQRLALARVLLRKPRVVILDEATCCLDPVTEVDVLRTVRKQLYGSTLIVISHRPSTISNFARVLFLSQGSVAEGGVCKGNPA